MRVVSNFKAVGIAVAALILPMQTVQAAEPVTCVEFEGLNHCSIGGATLLSGDEGLTVANLGDTGQAGVNISLGGLAVSWDASVAYKNSNPSRQQVVHTAISEDKPTSTATLGLAGSRLDFAATFTGAGESSTYSVFVYRDGVYQGGLGGIPSGEVAAREAPGGVPPLCRQPWVRLNDCLNSCNYSSCSYCYNVCEAETTSTNFHRAARAACVWEFGTGDGPRTWELPNGVQVVGDRIVLSEEVGEGGSYPYLSFDTIVLQGTVDSVTLVNESVVEK